MDSLIANLAALPNMEHFDYGVLLPLGICLAMVASLLVRNPRLDDGRELFGMGWRAFVVTTVLTGGLTMLMHYLDSDKSGLSILALGPLFLIFKELGRYIFVRMSCDVFDPRYFARSIAAMAFIQALVVDVFCAQLSGIGARWVGGAGLMDGLLWTPLQFGLGYASLTWFFEWKSRQEYFKASEDLLKSSAA